MTATLYRDRSRGNCTYYRLTRPAGVFLSVTPLVSVSNSDSVSFVHVCREPRTMVVRAFGMTPVGYSDLESDVRETEARMDRDLSLIREVI